MIRIVRCLFAALLGLVPLPDSAAKDTVNVAVVVPLSGPFANVGELDLKHAQLVIDGINSRGGVLGGQNLEIVSFDSKNSPQEALLLLNQIADRGIRFISYCCAAHIAVALSEAVERHNNRRPEQSLLFLVEGGDQDLTNEKCSFWTFAFLANAEMMMDALTSYAAKQPGIKRVYLINQDYQWGHQNHSFARAMLARKRPDIAIVGDDLHPMGKIKDFSPYVAKIRAAKPDVVITANWGNDMVLLVKAAAEFGLAEFYTYFGSIHGAPTAMGKSAVDKVKGIWRWHPNIEIEKERLAREEYRRRYNLEYYAMPSSNLFEMLAKAVNDTGSTDPLRVAYALENIRIQGNIGEVWMRRDDHQLFEALYILSLTAVNGRDVKYGVEGTEIGTRTEARIEAADTILPTRCQMQRPPKP